MKGVPGDKSAKGKTALERRELECSGIKNHQKGTRPPLRRKRGGRSRKFKGGSRLEKLNATGEET